MNSLGTSKSPKFLLEAGLSVLVCLLGLLQSNCDRAERPRSGAATSASSHVTVSSRNTPGGTEEIALLDGLSVGDVLEGYLVTWIGSVREDGAMEVRLEGGGRPMRLAVALDSKEPRPPVRTSKYALYYEASGRPHAASEQDCLRVLEALAKRIRKVEEVVPTPSGMRALSPRAIQL